MKGGMEIDPDNLSADLKDGPLSALTVDANLPAEDRLCRSMSAPGMVAVAEGECFDYYCNIASIN